MHKIRQLLRGREDTDKGPVAQVDTEKETSPSPTSQSDEFTDQVELFIRKHVQIKPEDCLGCKIVATLTVTFISGTMASQFPKLNSQLPQRWKSVTTYGQYSALALFYVWFMKTQWFYNTSGSVQQSSAVDNG